jgi:hypothetical protein
MNVDLVKRKDYLNEPFYKDRKIIYGGFKGEMSWGYYLTGFESELHPRLELIKDYVNIFAEDMMNEFRSQRFNETYFFLFEDNFSMSFTLRSWGDFMAAILTDVGNFKKFYGIED